jgi:plasmid replication initiation protein
MAKVGNKNSKAIVLIKKSNNLVESRYKFDIWETRFFLSILSQIRKDDTDLRPYRIWYKDIIKTFGLTSGDAYASLREAAKSLIRKPVRTSYNIDGVLREQEVTLITEIDYLVGGTKTENHEYIDVVVQEKMKPLLLQLQKNFTAYDLRNVVKLGVYSVRIYEILKQYESIGSRTLMIGEMKTMFDLKHEYQKYNDFFRWVIKPSEDEINNYTDLLILNIEKQKEGKKVVSLRFKFRKKTDAELSRMTGSAFRDTSFDEVEEVDFDEVETLKKKGVAKDITPTTDTESDKNSTLSDKHEKLIAELYALVVIKFGVSLKVLMNLVQKYTEADIKQAVKVTEKAILTGKIANIAGFFVEALRGAYQDTSAKKDTKTRKDAPQKEKQLREQQQEEKRKQDIKTLFEQRKAIFERLIEEDDTFWLELEESIRADNMIRNHYDHDKTVYDNMQTPMIAGALIAIAAKLRADVFSY